MGVVDFRLLRRRGSCPPYDFRVSRAIRDGQQGHVVSRRRGRTRGGMRKSPAGCRSIRGVQIVGDNGSGHGALP